MPIKPTGIASTAACQHGCSRNRVFLSDLLRMMKTINLDKWCWFSFKYGWGFKYGDHLIHFNIIYLSKGDTSKSTIEKNNTEHNMETGRRWVIVPPPRLHTCMLSARGKKPEPEGYTPKISVVFRGTTIVCPICCITSPVAFLSVASDPYEIKGQWQVQKPPRLLSLPEGRPF